MIGIIPSTTKTFMVEDFIGKSTPIEGKLYIDENSKRIFIYSTKETRSNPNTGYFPIWDGKKFYITKFSNKKYLDKDVKRTDVSSLVSSINENLATDILYRQRRSVHSEILRPQLVDGDNMFTQCVKGILNSKELTLIDLVDMSYPKLSEKVITNYYSALTKITFMRFDKWNIWIDNIFHLQYSIEIFDNGNRLLSYYYPKEIFDTGIVKYDNIVKNKKDDPLKKIIKILMIMRNINKNTLKSKEVDDYTINNMMTTINGNKVLSAQLFSRFIRMSKLEYKVTIYKDKTIIFEYNE